jgi:hypothetical protein
MGSYRDAHTNLLLRDKTTTCIAFLSVAFIIYMGVQTGALSLPCWNCSHPEFGIWAKIAVEVHSSTIFYEDCVYSPSQSGEHMDATIQSVESQADALVKIAHEGGNKKIGDHQYVVAPKNSIATRLRLIEQSPYGDAIDIQRHIASESFGIDDALKGARANRIASQILRKGLEENEKIPCNAEELTVIGCGILILQHLPSSRCFIVSENLETQDHLHAWYTSKTSEVYDPHLWCLDYWEQNYDIHAEDLAEYKEWRDSTPNKAFTQCELFFPDV